jgi:hypothetical protein
LRHFHAVTGLCQLFSSYSSAASLFLAWRRQLHQRDLEDGLARVALPDALARKYPRTAQEFGWQFVFASRQRSRDPKTGDIGRHHVHVDVLTRAATS